MTSTSTESTTLQQKFLAIRTNATAHYSRLASAQDSPVGQFGSLLATEGYAVICHQDEDDANIDRLLQWYRDHGTAKAPILYWIDSSRPGALDAKFLARGASPNWQPHWMWCGLTCAQGDVTKTCRQDVEVRASTKEELMRSENEEDRVNGRLIDMYPEMVFHIAAWEGDRRIGRCLLNLTDGEFGVAGLFDMEVDSGFRRQGIGTALVRKTMEIARAKGKSSMYLNATPDGELLYRTVGFASLGMGHSWHLRKGFAETSENDKELVRIVERIMLGDVEALTQALDRHSVDLEVLSRPTANTMTPLELAVYAEQSESAKALLNHGGMPDITSLWKLHLKYEAQDWIEKQPGLVNRKGGENGITPLHFAVEQNDTELAELLLSVGECDLTIKDDAFSSTPAGWAEYMNRPEILQMIKSRMHHEKSSM